MRSEGRQQIMGDMNQTLNSSGNAFAALVNGVAAACATAVSMALLTPPPPAQGPSGR